MEENADRSQFFTLVASFLLVAGMMACLAQTFVQVGEAILTGWQGDYLVWLAFFVALESLYSQRRLSRISFAEPEFVLYRVAELVLIFVVLKVAYYLVNGFDLLRLDIPLWGEDFGRYFFSSEYILGVVVLFLIWLICGAFSASLSDLEVTEQALRVEVESGVFEQRPQVRESLANMFLGLGLLMIFVTTALRLDAVANWMEIPALRGGVYNLLVYFLLGLVLLSLTQYNLMRVRWILDRLPVSKEIPVRWFSYSFILILIVALVASLLPTSYSIGILAVLKFLATGLMVLVTLLVTLIATPFLFLFNLILSLLGSEQVSTTLPPPPVLEPPPAVVEQAPLPWLEMLKSILFWAVFVFVIGFSLYYYLRDHEELLVRLRGVPFFSLLGRFWDWLRRGLGRVNRQLSAVVDDGLQRLRQRLRRKPAETAWKFINLRSLSPRQRVYFYYMALLRRAGEKGYQRKASQTPYEYSQRLSGALQSEIQPDADGASLQELQGFTERFVDARYSLHTVTDQDVSLVRRYWEHLRKLLRRR